MGRSPPLDFYFGDTDTMMRIQKRHHLIWESRHVLIHFTCCYLYWIHKHRNLFSIDSSFPVFRFISISSNKNCYDVILIWYGQFVYKSILHSMEIVWELKGKTTQAIYENIRWVLNYHSEERFLFSCWWWNKNARVLDSANWRDFVANCDSCWRSKKTPPGISLLNLEPYDLTAWPPRLDKPLRWGSNKSMEGGSLKETPWNLPFIAKTLEVW